MKQNRLQTDAQSSLSLLLATQVRLPLLIYKEASGYSVWSTKPYTGDRAECEGLFNSKREARRYMKSRNRA